MNLDNVEPLANDFRLIEVAFMSNNTDERWAIVTPQNTSSGKWLFKNDHIVATFSNGGQSRAFDLVETLDGGENLTNAVHFGTHKIPVIQVRFE